jgi:hypothetical protein
LKYLFPRRPNESPEVAPALLANGFSLISC